MFIFQISDLTVYNIPLIDVKMKKDKESLFEDKCIVKVFSKSENDLESELQ